MGLLDFIERENLARGLLTPSGNPVGRWIQGVAQRTLHPLDTLANEANRWRFMPAEELAGNFGPSGGLLGMFAGKGAKTADLAKLAMAEKLRAQNIPDEQIWKETGWTFGFPDKMPRFEIPDDAAKFSEIPSWGQLHKRLPLASTVEHPDLYSAYSDVANINLLPVSSQGSNLGAYDAANNAIEMLGVPTRKQVSTKKAYDLNLTSARGTTLHELQHAIQQREGFARGGSPDALQLEYNNARARLNFLEKEPDLIEGQKKIDALWSDVFDTQKISPEQAIKIEQEIYSAHPSLEEAKDVMQTLRTIGDESGYNSYKRLAGEAEARLTQARMNLTPEQRLAQYPYEPQYFQQTTGVPFSDLIVRTSP